MKPIQAIIIGAVAIASAGGAYFFSQAPVQPPAKANVAVQEAIPAGSAAPVKGIRPMEKSAGKGTASSSPFAVIPSPSMQASEPQPAAMTSPIPSEASLPNYSFLPASLPGMREQIRVVAVIPAPHHKGQAIVADGGEQVIVEEGGTSKWGLVSQITDKGLIINEHFISIDASEEQLSPLPIAPIPFSRK